MNARPLSLVCLLSLGFGACSSARPPVERFHVQNRIDAGQFPDVPAVVLLDRTELLLSYDAKTQKPYAQSTHLVRTQIQTEAGLSYAKVAIPYDDRSRVLDLQSRVFKPDGRTIEMPRERQVTLPRFPAGSRAAQLYNDDGYLLTKLSSVEVGDVIEVSYVRVYRDARWLEPIAIGGTLPVVRGEVVVEHPSAYDVDFRVTRLGRNVSLRPTRLPTRVKGPDGKGEGVPGTRYVYVFENERAIYPEESGPALDALKTQVHVALQGYSLRGQRYDAYRSWNDVATWYLELTAGRDQPDAAIGRLIAETGGKGGSKEDKLVRVQRFLQDRIDDVPTFLNLAALPAQAPAALLDAQVGDAKDQASLGLAMLRALGIEAIPVLVARQGSFASVPDLPSPAPFNHVVLAIPAGGSYRFIDPSTPFLQAGRLPGALQGEPALLVRRGAAELIRLPEDRAADNTRELSFDLALSRNGWVSGQIQVTLSGVDAARARQLIHAGGQQMNAQLADMLFPDEATRLPWQQVLVVGGAEGNAERPLKLQVILAPSAVARETAAGLLLEMDRILGKPFPGLWRESRRLPLIVSHRYTERKKVSLSLPEGLGVDALPVALEQASATLGVSERWAIADGVLWLDRRLRVDARQVPPDAYEAFRTPVMSLWNAQLTPIVIVPGGDRGQSYGEDPF